MAQQPPLTKKEYVEYYSFFAITLDGILNIRNTKWNLIKQFNIVDLSLNQQQVIDEIGKLNTNLEKFAEDIKHKFDNYNLNYDHSTKTKNILDIVLFENIKEKFYNLIKYTTQKFNFLL